MQLACSGQGNPDLAQCLSHVDKLVSAIVPAGAGQERGLPCVTLNGQLLQVAPFHSLLPPCALVTLGEHLLQVAPFPSRLPCARVPLGVLVGHDRADRLHDRGRHKVLRGDQLKALRIDK